MVKNEKTTVDTGYSEWTLVEAAQSRLRVQTPAVPRVSFKRPIGLLVLSPLVAGYRHVCPHRAPSTAPDSHPVNKESLGPFERTTYKGAARVGAHPTQSRATDEDSFDNHVTTQRLNPRGECDIVQLHMESARQRGARVGWRGSLGAPPIL